MRQVGLDQDAAGAVERDAERPRQRRGGHTRGPEDRPRVDSLGADADAVGVDSGDLHSGPDGHTQLLELLRAAARELFRVGAQHPRARLDQDHAGRGRVDVAEVARQRLPRDLGQRAGQLDAGRPAADDHERHPGPPPVSIGLALGDLECHEHPLPDLQAHPSGSSGREHARPSRRGRNTRGSRPSPRSGRRNRPRRRPG